MAGRWRDALEVMEDMVMEGGVAPNSVTYASAINACGNARQLERALELLREARLAGIKVGCLFLSMLVCAMLSVLCMFADSYLFLLLLVFRQLRGVLVDRRALVLLLSTFTQH